MKYIPRSIQLPTLFIASALIFATPSISLAADDKHDGHDHSEHNHDDHDHSEHKHDDHESHHGGIVSTADGLHHELVLTEAGKIIFYAEGLPKGEAAQAVTVRLTILQDKAKQSLAMVRSEDDAHRFEAPIDPPLKAGDKVVALIQLTTEKMRMVRFEVTAETKEKPKE